MLKRLLLAVFAIVTTVSVVAIAQTWPNLPILGGASYCASTVNNVCVSTIPAGPALTGLETVPADTNVTTGSGPTTGKFNITSLGAGLLVYNAPLTGASITLTAATRNLILEPAGTIATLTVVFPAATALLNGQKLGLCSTQIVTALTITPGAGTTVSNTQTATIVPLGTGAAACPEWIYRTANTTWYRVH